MVSSPLIDRIKEQAPNLRGRLVADAPLGPTTWFRVGGNAELLFRPADRDDLAYFRARCPADVPVTVIGVASNLLVRDGGVPGVVIRLGGAFAEIHVEGEMIIAGAGALDLNVALTAQQAGLTGLEFLSGIPGTIGGAIRMNGGAYGGELVDVIDWAEGVDGQGHIRRWTRDELHLTYRHCGLPEDVIFTAAALRGRPDDRDAIQARIEAIQQTRADSQPVRARTGGSTFANPEGHKAWQLIDAAGCRGLTIGGAQISEKHCNFLINLGDATAEDIESLGEEVRRRVKAQSGIDLRWEIRRIGVPRSHGGAG
ncbi:MULTISPECIES: UDP-N-acetylmuramate dehydrogenase [unclassified Azospirillum]|uniref:UDP-N-acetylmuramate dehydrogenase n=1 Tax=unclassified Azospirillum TaxID=2630922 RepID=UPI000B647A41|nr:MULTISPECIES: UDP-N-acetylmuramate dehydrogenase [unclassified Azospirillum]SNR92558.1 UDP-N-acetylmuramate dehydrogenase [Azospirillum sp. RU38E]SNS08507.1 UDP-N-acetylmuramate dehydrogenase [Azospirillum sp. RU37A]